MLTMAEGKDGEDIYDSTKLLLELASSGLCHHVIRFLLFITPYELGSLLCEAKNKRNFMFYYLSFIISHAIQTFDSFCLYWMSTGTFTLLTNSIPLFFR